MIQIDLSGKHALITASSRGIGKGIAKILSISGADILMVSRNIDRLSKAAEEIKIISNADVYYSKADLTKLEDLDKIIEKVRELFGNVDIFVFNTGGPRPGYFNELSIDDWRDAVSLLLYPAVYLTKAFIEDMKNRRWGRIIYSTSIAIKEPVNGLILSNTVRISMAGLVRTLAKEYGPYGVTINAIMPGYIETERIRELASKRATEEGKSINDVISDMAKNIPAGRMGRPEELGYLAAFLASEYASYINGAIIPVDGGLLSSSL